MDANLYEILTRLSENEFKTSRDLSKELSISDKTFRNRIKEINEIIEKYGASIISKKHYGYLLEIKNHQLFDKLIEESNEINFPNTTDERKKFILKILLNEETFVKIDYFSEELYISRNTISNILKKIENDVATYNLEIERRPNYGVRIVGSELDKRICIINNYSDEFNTREYEELIKSIVEENNKNGISMSEISFDYFMKYIIVSINRISKNHRILASYQNEKFSDKFKNITREYINIIENMYGVLFCRKESDAFMLQFVSVLPSDSYIKFAPNFVITNRINNLVLKILDIINSTLRIDFSDDLDLILSLSKHLVLMDIRMKYDIFIKNPLLDELKREYSLSYTIALTGSIILESYYNKRLPEEEIGLIAIIFALSLEQKNEHKRKKNIILVCESGLRSSNLLKLKCKRNFGDFLGNIYECSVEDIKKFDFEKNNIDYIFTTTHLNMKFTVPILEINLFPRKEDINRYRKQLEESVSESWLKYFSRELFIPNLDLDKKEDIIKEMCNCAKKNNLTSDNFLDSVLIREKMGKTDLENLVAIPHPYEMMSESSFVIVATLKRPILWESRKVQVIFLISIGNEKNKNLEEFYDKISNVFFDENRINYLINNSSYEALLEILH